MSELRYGVVSGACALCLVLAGCSSDSPSTANSIETNPVVADGQQSLVIDGANVDLVQSPLNDEPLSGSGPEGDSQVTVDAISYPLNSALGDIWGVENDHYNVDFTLTNGQFLVSESEVDGVTHSLLVPVEATATMFAELYSPGDSLMFVTYSYSSLDVGNAALAGNAFFNRAFVGVDTNNSGDIENNEKIDIIGGTIEFTGTLPDIELRFSVTLANGQSAEGHYTGLFDFADRQN